MIRNLLKIRQLKLLQ